MTTEPTKGWRYFYVFLFDSTHFEIEIRQKNGQISKGLTCVLQKHIGSKKKQNKTKKHLFLDLRI